MELTLPRSESHLFGTSGNITEYSICIVLMVSAMTHRARMRLHSDMLFAIVAMIPRLGLSMSRYAAITGCVTQHLTETYNINWLGDSYWLVSWPQARDTGTFGL